MGAHQTDTTTESSWWLDGNVKRELLTQFKLVFLCSLLDLFHRHVNSKLFHLSTTHIFSIYAKFAHRTQSLLEYMQNYIQYMFVVKVKYENTINIVNIVC